MQTVVQYYPKANMVTLRCYDELLYGTSFKYLPAMRWESKEKQSSMELESMVTKGWVFQPRLNDIFLFFCATGHGK